MLTLKVAVVIPLYNKGPDIQQALKSVINQTFDNFEVIVVDDGSTDGGAELATAFGDHRIRLIHQENQGASKARNAGIAEARADLVAFLDADDEWMPNHLKTIMRLRKNFPEAGIYATSYQIVTHSKMRIQAQYKHIPAQPRDGLLPNYFKSLAYGSNPAWTSVVAIPKNILSEFKGFPEGYTWAQDMGLFGKIALKYPVAFSWDMGGIYHKDADNCLSDMARPVEYKEPFVETALTALENGKVKPEFAGPLNEYIFRVEAPRAKKYILSGDPKAARNILSKCKPQQYYRYSIKVALQILSILPYPIIRFLSKVKLLRPTPPYK